MNNLCKMCGEPPRRRSYIFCSNKCQIDFQYQVYIGEWKLGKVDGSRGLKAKSISKHIKRYLTEKYGERCSLCGWSKRHPVTKHVPLEIDHIDGNADNNIENNLRLLCPNCHALTPKYRNLNKGNGRQWRREKYMRVVK